MGITNIINDKKNLLNEISCKMNIENTNNCEKIDTPGIERGGKQAAKDIKELNVDVSDNDQEMKEIESDDQFDVADYSTPMGIEGGQLQFSGLDLNKGMIEIQNMGETNIGLNGYSMSNKSGG